MAKIILTSWKIGNTGSNPKVKIVFKLSHKHQRRIINTFYQLLPSQFCNGKVINHEFAKDWNDVLQGKFSEYLGELTKIAGIINELDIDQVKDKITASERKGFNSVVTVGEYD